eukprot:6116331-Alexandrium_andersonii.AAC.1
MDAPVGQKSGSCAVGGASTGTIGSTFQARGTTGGRSTSTAVLKRPPEEATSSRPLARVGH